MYTSVNETQYRLELFDGKAYHVAATGTLRELEPATDAARAAGNKSRRITLAAKDRPAVPKYRKPPCGHGRGEAYNGYKPFYVGGLDYAKWAIATYLDWARAKGLETVTAYRGHESERRARMNCWQGDSVRLVEVADFLGDAPQAEPDADYMPEAMAA